MPTRHPPRITYARCEHTCAVCGQTIRVQEAHDSQTTVDGVKVTVRRTHLGCTPSEYLF